MNKKVLGNYDALLPTYLKNEDVKRRDIVHVGKANQVLAEKKEGLFAAYVLFRISTEKLNNFRTIFYDPEGITVKGNQYKSTYIVFGGIPLLSIDSFSIKMETVNF